MDTGKLEKRDELMGENTKTEQGICPETIAVREGEAFDQERLDRYLKDRIEGTGGPLSVKQFAGGHANLTYMLKYGEREYVLRRPPLGAVANKSHDMGREYRVLSALYKKFLPAPQALIYSDDTSIIGAPFFIMERKKGTVVRTGVPPEFGSGLDKEKNRIISETLVDTLVELHQVDYRAIGLDGLGRPEGYMERQVLGWADRYDRAKTKEIDFLKDLKAWLVDKVPVSQDYVLLHNDFRLDNIMLDPSDPRKVVGVFDWDMCTLGDPLADVGCLLSFWFEQGEGLGDMMPMPSDLPGFMTRKEAIQRYGEKSGRDMAKIDFYYIFGLFKMAVIVQQIFYRYDKGQTKDPRFKMFGIGAELLLTLAWDKVRSSIL